MLIKFKILTKTNYKLRNPLENSTTLQYQFLQKIWKTNMICFQNLGSWDNHNGVNLL